MFSTTVVVVSWFERGLVSVLVCILLSNSVPTMSKLWKILTTYNYEDYYHYFNKWKHE